MEILSVQKVGGSLNAASHWHEDQWKKKGSKSLKLDVPAMTEGARTCRRLCGEKRTQRTCRRWFIASDSSQTRNHVTPPRTPTCSQHEPPRPPSRTGQLVTTIPRMPSGVVYFFKNPAWACVGEENQHVTSQYPFLHSWPSKHARKLSQLPFLPVTGTLEMRVVMR